MTTKERILASALRLFNQDGVEIELQEGEKKQSGRKHTFAWRFGVPWEFIGWRKLAYLNALKLRFRSPVRCLPGIRRRP